MIDGIRTITMDINELRSLLTVAGFLCFVSICSWAFSAHRQKAFEEAARLPFTDPEELAEQRRAMLLR